MSLLHHHCYIMACHCYVMVCHCYITVTALLHHCYITYIMVTSPVDSPGSGGSKSEEVSSGEEQSVL